MKASSIGIIGGADGPTAIFVAGNPLSSIIWGAILLGVILVGLLVWFRRR